MAETLECGTPESLMSATEVDATMVEKKLVDGTKVGFVRDEETLVSETVIAQERKTNNSFRAEIDTSLPFESVKEAVCRFGGSGVWKPQTQTQTKSLETEDVVEELGMEKVEKQAAELEKELIVKERETLEVLKELESTKKMVEDLKWKLQKEACESIAVPVLNADNTNVGHGKEREDQCFGSPVETHQDSMGGLSLCPSSSPGLILMELKQAKVNLTRTTSDLAGIRASVDTLNKKIEKERTSLNKTHERLRSNSSRIASLEEELNLTRLKLQLAKDAETKGSSENPIDISKELKKLSSEAEEFRKMAEGAKSEVLRAMSEIERTKTSIRTAEIRWIAATKMAEAARATEAVALAEIKALLNSEKSSGDPVQQLDGVTLTFEEYSSLTRKAQEAEEFSKKRVLDAMLHIDEANVSKMEILKKVEAASKEVKVSKKALEEAQNRVEVANRGKLKVEESLRKWRSEHGQKRRSVSSSTKFKNYSLQHRRESRHYDLNEFHMVNNGSKPVLRQTLSIGQILSRKLLLPGEEIEVGMHSENVMDKRPKVSLAQMLGKPAMVLSPPQTSEQEENVPNPCSAKRKKSGLARFSLLLAKQSKNKKKKQAPRITSTRYCRITNLTDFTPCSLCKTLGAALITSLGKPGSQAVVTGLLNFACVSFTELEPECSLFVDFAAPIIISILRRQKPDELCTIFFVCNRSSRSSYNVRSVSAKKIMDKVEYAATQFQIIEALVKVCNAQNQYTENCKKLVTEYMPLILINAKQFLETSDLDFY